MYFFIHPGPFPHLNCLMANYEIGSQRIRGPFDPGPYSAAIHSCERFLEHIVEVRQSSLFFQPFLFGGKDLVSRAYLAPNINANFRIKVPRNLRVK